MIFNKGMPPLRTLMLLLTWIIAGQLIDSFSQTKDRSDSRGIWPREYAKRISDQIAKQRPQSSQTQKPPAAVYTPESPNHSPISGGADIGVTFWRLRYANSADPQEVLEDQRITRRKQGHAPASMVKMIAERADIRDTFADGDLMRISIEAPTEAYIYILNRERYLDGSFSEPYLIYPSSKDTGIADKTMPGRLIFIPRAPDYFELTRLADAGAQKEAEVYTVILSEKPIKNLRPLGSSEQIRKIRAAKLNRWERKWGGPVWRFANQTSRRKAITSKERIAMRINGELLTGGDALPQNIYHVANKPGKPLLFTVAIPIR